MGILCKIFWNGLFYQTLIFKLFFFFSGLELNKVFLEIFPISVDSHDLQGNQIPQIMTNKLIHETVMASCEFIAFEERTPKSTLMATPLEEPCQTVTFQRPLSLEQ